MLTQCPKCETIYRLSASDLGSAEGFVQCGECAEQFNALHRLADEPSFAKPTENGVAIAAATTQASGPAFTLMDTDMGDETIEPVVTTTNSSRDDALELDNGQAETEATFFDVTATPETQRSAATPIDVDTIVDVGRFHRTDNDTVTPKENSLVGAGTLDLGSTATSQTLPGSEHEILFTDPSGEVPNSEEEPGEALPQQIDDVPAILQKDVAALRKNRSSMRWVWSLTSFARRSRSPTISKYIAG